MRDEILRNLLRVWDATPDSRIDMRTWSSDCGTTHCLAGHARLDPWICEHTAIDKEFNVDPCSSGIRVVCARNMDACSGLAVVFEISYEDSFKLFGGGLRPYDRVPRNRVRCNIERLIVGLPAISYRHMTAWKEIES